MEVVNSHIQITKSLLENFSHKTKDGKKVYYLDLSDNMIKEEKIRRLGTELGYYSEDIEKFLSEEVENKIGRIAKHFKDFSNKKIQQLIITPEDKYSVKTFFKYSLIRSNQIIRETNKASIFSRFCGGYTANQIISVAGKEIFDTLFEDYDVDILLNNSNIEFVVPRNCFYSAMVKGKPTNYILPINPRTAFILIHKSELSHYIIDNIHRYPQINDDDIADRFNKRAWFDEKYFNNAFVVASRRKELEDLKIYIYQQQNQINNG